MKKIQNAIAHNAQRKNVFMQFNPDTWTLSDRYGLLISVIQPRPIAWVSTQGKNGSLNLAPFSFFTGITGNPLSVCFCPVNTREGRRKDTLLNIEQTKQFVVNIVTEAWTEKMNQTSADYPYGVSEFEKAGLTPMASTIVKPPRVKESPINLECELLKLVSISEGPMGGSIVVGKVVYVHIADTIWKNNKIDHRDLKTVGRLEGSWYSRTTDTFEMPRPKI